MSIEKYRSSIRNKLHISSLASSKACQAVSENIDCERIIAGDIDVHSQIKFAPIDQKWVSQIPKEDIIMLS